MTFQVMSKLMKEAVPLAQEMEGDWQARMKLAMISVKVNYFMKQPISKEIIEALLKHGVSYRRISRNYKVGRSDISALESQ